MPPPVNRRTGYSRRAQYSVFFSYVAGVLAALVGAALLLAALGGGAAGMRGLAADVASPFARAASGVRAGVGGMGDDVAGFATSGAENARLKREVALARSRATETAAIAQQNQRLTALLQLAGNTPRPVASGWLIASTSSAARRYATVSVGANRGVAIGMPVRGPLGLVGRVVEVGRISARVLLVLDANSIVPARRASDGLPVIVSGRGDGTLAVRLLTLAQNPLHPGDAIVASGSGGIYWPNTPIAVVASTSRDGAVARALADPAASDAVLVQPAWDPTTDPSLPPPSDNAPPPAKPKPKPAHPPAKPHRHWL